MRAGARRRSAATPRGGATPIGAGSNVVAYVESHIEQGPVLLNEGLPVGVVTAIAGAHRGSASRVDRPRRPRRHGADGRAPGCARRRGEMVLVVERHCEAHAGLVGTVGKMSVLPGAVNVIPQDVAFTVDVRSGDDALRLAAIGAIRAGFGAIARRRDVTVDVADLFARATPRRAIRRCRQAFADAIAAHGIPVRHLPSGAGHDAMEFPAVAPIGDAVRALRQQRHQPPSGRDDDGRGRGRRDVRAPALPRELPAALMSPA